MTECCEGRIDVLKIQTKCMSREKTDSVLWLKFVDPNDMAEEHFEVYEKNLEKLS